MCLDQVVPSEIDIFVIESLQFLMVHPSYMCGDLLRRQWARSPPGSMTRGRNFMLLFLPLLSFIFILSIIFISLRKLRVSLRENLNSKNQTAVRSKQHDSTQAVSLCGPFCGHQDNKVSAYGFPPGLQMFLSRRPLWRGILHEKKNKTKFLGEWAVQIKGLDYL